MPVDICIRSVLIVIYFTSRLIFFCAIRCLPNRIPVVLFLRNSSEHLFLPIIIALSHLSVTVLFIVVEGKCFYAIVPVAVEAIYLCYYYCIYGYFIINNY